jgi:hypothetical protein
MTPKEIRNSMMKPTINTPFHIDYEWWKQNDNNWRVHLFSCLCQEHQDIFQVLENNQMIDWVDPETAEIIPVDGLQHILMTHCSKQVDFITTNSTMIDAVFRVFLSNGNSPISPLELSSQIQKPADTILKTLSGSKVYKGIKPCPLC